METNETLLEKVSQLEGDIVILTNIVRDSNTSIEFLTKRIVQLETQLSSLNEEEP